MTEPSTLPQGDEGGTMMKFRKKPVVVEAEQFWPETAPLPFEKEGVCCFADPYGWHVETLVEGPLALSPGDWVIKGIKGEFYPCKPDIFEATYEPVRPPASEPYSREEAAKTIARTAPEWVETEAQHQLARAEARGRRELLDAILGLDAWLSQYGLQVGKWDAVTQREAASWLRDVSAPMRQEPGA